MAGAIALLPAPSPSGPCWTGRPPGWRAGPVGGGAAPPPPTWRRPRPPPRSPRCPGWPTRSSSARTVAGASRPYSWGRSRSRWPPGGVPGGRRPRGAAGARAGDAAARRRRGRRLAGLRGGGRLRLRPGRRPRGRALTVLHGWDPRADGAAPRPDRDAWAGRRPGGGHAHLTAHRRLARAAARRPGPGAGASVVAGRERCWRRPTRPSSSSSAATAGATCGGSCSARSARPCCVSPVPVAVVPPRDPAQRVTARGSRPSSRRTPPGRSTAGGRSAGSGRRGAAGPRGRCRLRPCSAPSPAYDVPSSCPPA